MGEGREMVQPKLKIVPMARLRNDHVADRPFGEDPACAYTGTPDLWDLETHQHGGFWMCDQCQQALEICDGCPVRARCGQIGQKLGNPWFIYGGRSWTRYGPSPACRRCRTPLHGAGVRRASGMCSATCERNSVKPSSDTGPDQPSR
jgi:hypothetical protein